MGDILPEIIPEEDSLFTFQAVESNVKPEPLADPSPGPHLVISSQYNFLIHSTPTGFNISTLSSTSSLNGESNIKILSKVNLEQPASLHLSIDELSLAVLSQDNHVISLFDIPSLASNKQKPAVKKQWPKPIKALSWCKSQTEILAILTEDSIEIVHQNGLKVLAQYTIQSAADLDWHPSDTEMAVLYGDGGCTILAWQYPKAFSVVYETFPISSEINAINVKWVEPNVIVVGAVDQYDFHCYLGKYNEDDGTILWSENLPAPISDPDVEPKAFIAYSKEEKLLMIASNTCQEVELCQIDTTAEDDTFKRLVIPDDARIMISDDWVSGIALDVSKKSQTKHQSPILIISTVNDIMFSSFVSVDKETPIEYPEMIQTKQLPAHGTINLDDQDEDLEEEEEENDEGYEEEDDEEDEEEEEEEDEDFDASQVDSDDNQDEEESEDLETSISELSSMPKAFSGPQSATDKQDSTSKNPLFLSTQPKVYAPLPIQTGPKSLFGTTNAPFGQGFAKTTTTFGSPAKTPSGFGFGGFGQKSETNKPSLSIGQPSADDAKKQEAAKQAFSLGPPPTDDAKKQEAAKQAFSLGPPPTDESKKQEAAKQAFSLGPPPTDDAKKQEAAKQAFSLGPPPTDDAKKQEAAKQAFSLGPPPTDDAKKQEAAKQAFSLGPPPTDEAKKQEAAKQAFSLGPPPTDEAKKQEAAKQAFSLGPPPTDNTKKTEATKPTTSFGFPATDASKKPEAAKPTTSFGFPATEAIKKQDATKQTAPAAVPKEQELIKQQQPNKLEPATSTSGPQLVLNEIGTSFANLLADQQRRMESLKQRSSKLRASTQAIQTGNSTAPFSQPELYELGNSLDKSLEHIKLWLSKFKDFRNDSGALKTSLANLEMISYQTSSVVAKGSYIAAEADSETENERKLIRQGLNNVKTTIDELAFKFNELQAFVSKKKHQAKSTSSSTANSTVATNRVAWASNDSRIPLHLQPKVTSQNSTSRSTRHTTKMDLSKAAFMQEKQIQSVEMQVKKLERQLETTLINRPELFAKKQEEQSSNSPSAFSCNPEYWHSTEIRRIAHSARWVELEQPLWIHGGKVPDSTRSSGSLLALVKEPSQGSKTESILNAARASVQTSQKSDQVSRSGSMKLSKSSATLTKPASESASYSSEEEDDTHKEESSNEETTTNSPPKASMFGIKRRSPQKAASKPQENTKQTASPIGRVPLTAQPLGEFSSPKSTAATAVSPASKPPPAPLSPPFNPTPPKAAAPPLELNSLAKAASNAAPATSAKIATPAPAASTATQESLSKLQKPSEVSTSTEKAAPISKPVEPSTAKAAPIVAKPTGFGFSANKTSVVPSTDTKAPEIPKPTTFMGTSQLSSSLKTPATPPSQPTKEADSKSDTATTNAGKATVVIDSSQPPLKSAGTIQNPASVNIQAPQPASQSIQSQPAKIPAEAPASAKKGFGFSSGGFGFPKVASAAPSTPATAAGPAQATSPQTQPENAKPESKEETATTTPTTPASTPSPFTSKPGFAKFSGFGSSGKQPTTAEPAKAAPSTPPKEPSAQQQAPEASKQAPTTTQPLAPKPAETAAAPKPFGSGFAKTSIGSAAPATGSFGFKAQPAQATGQTSAAPTAQQTGFSTQAGSTGFNSQAAKTTGFAQPASTGFSTQPQASTGFNTQPQASTGFNTQPQTSTGFNNQPKPASTGFSTQPQASTGFNTQPQASTGFSNQNTGFAAKSPTTGFQSAGSGSWTQRSAQPVQATSPQQQQQQQQPSTPSGGAFSSFGKGFSAAGTGFSHSFSGGTPKTAAFGQSSQLGGGGFGQPSGFGQNKLSPAVGTFGTGFSKAGGGGFSAHVSPTSGGNNSLSSFSVTQPSGANFGAPRR